MRRRALGIRRGLRLQRHLGDGRLGRRATGRGCPNPLRNPNSVRRPAWSKVDLPHPYPATSCASAVAAVRSRRGDLWRPTVRGMGAGGGSPPLPSVRVDATPIVDPVTSGIPGERRRAPPLPGQAGGAAAAGRGRGLVDTPASEQQYLQASYSRDPPTGRCPFRRTRRVDWRCSDAENSNDDPAPAGRRGSAGAVACGGS